MFLDKKGQSTGIELSKATLVAAIIIIAFLVMFIVVITRRFGAP